ncbi:MAG: DUF4132 domain-containing protein [Akkermansiaceae bacterium]|nr:DUF4132 domain-containing protein [Armatimonadota bacterium]
MLNPKVAEERLKEYSVDGSLALQKARVAELPGAFRQSAFALLGLKPDGTPFISDTKYDNKQYVAQNKAREAAYKQLDLLTVADLEKLFTAYFPRLGTLLAAWWKPDGSTLYQGSYNRRPFRMDRGSSSDESRNERRQILSVLLSSFAQYQEMPIEWFASWIPYLGAYNADNMGKLFAFAIDNGNDAVFQTLIESGKGEHEIGAMGRHVTRGLLSASREEGWEWIEKLLLAAQRQEGLRQSVLEVVDEAHPAAFRRMLKLIRENDLFRFSATVRAADTWFGMNWVAYEKLSVKQANAATETVETFLADPAGRDAVLAETTDGQTVYLALWSMAFDDAHAALKAALPLLSDPVLPRRYAALHLLTELRLKEARPAILTAFDDPDLRMAQKAFGAYNWYEGPATGTGMEALTAQLTEQDAIVTDMLEQTPGEGTPAWSFLSGLKEAVAGVVAVLKGDSDPEEEPTAEEKPASVDDDRFERIERNIPRFPQRAKELEPVIWEWDKQTAHAESLADRLPNLLGKRPIERLFPFVALMSSYGRSSIATTIANRKDKTPEMRELLFDLFADTQSYVRDSALKAVEKFTLADDEAERIEGLLTRKAADLRKASLRLLLKRGDEKVLQSGERLTGAKDANQRVAGLDLLTQMVEKKREPVRAKAIVTGFVAARADKLTAAEKAMVEPLTSDTHVKATLEDALGLMDKAKLTPFDAPRLPKEVPLLTSITALRILREIAALVEKYKETPITGKSYNDDEEEILLGNARWNFPTPDLTKTAEQDMERFPLREIVTAFWDNRSSDLRDADGLELIRAQSIATEPGFLHAFVHLKSAPQWITKQVGEVHAERDTKKEDKYEDRSYAINGFIAWLLRHAPPVESVLADHLLRSAEATLSVLADHAPDKGEKDWRLDGRYTIWLTAARHSLVQLPGAWNEEATKRLLRCVLWTYKPSKQSNRSAASIEEVATAFRLGMIGEHDLYRALLPEPPPRKENEYYYEPSFGELGQLSGRKAPLFDTTPGLREIVDNTRRRVLEVELRRGDTETAASRPALALRYAGGMDVLLKTVAAMGKETFARGYSYYGQSNRSNVFSHLIRATFPGATDTFETFAGAVKEAKLPEKRLVEVAVYAPQWAKHITHTLGWDGLSDAIWWFHAHTKGNDWSVNDELKETWTAEIADKTPLAASDLTEGAVDVAWFNRVYQTLGETRWKMLDDAAKYASSAGGHKRAQLFADAMRGRIARAELLARIEDKRNQDSLRALGLLPFADDTEDKEADLLLRYKAMQEFLRTSKQFGAQRQESEKLATRIGMENLARTAGYADPIRLTWAMEAAAVADLRDGAVTATVGETSVSLSINGLGLPEIAIVKNGKTLANIPPAVKKDPDVATLTARKTEITRQVSRMRESLENAMCRGDKFSGKELGELLEHPVLRPLLRSLVFIEAEGREAVSGYPIGENQLEDCDGAVFTVSPETALRIAHPYDLLHTGKWDRWQKDCFLRERIQPFKQAFRELYVLTESETTDGTKSQRYTGHQVNPKQALALFNKRGWIGGGEYDYDGEGPRKTYHEDGYTVSVNFMGYTMGPADVEGSTLEEIRFTKKGDWKYVELKTVPPRVFSEAMRDLDLVVSVAHVGGVDPEASQSTTEMRAALLREMMSLLKIENVRLEKTHALIDGKLATYSVHLGSAVVHRQPGGYLCIVPVHSQHRGRIFLPFVDSDPRTAEVMSKVITLAKDSEIKDPTILEQILAVR